MSSLPPECEVRVETHVVRKLYIKDPKTGDMPIAFKLEYIAYDRIIKTHWQYKADPRICPPVPQPLQINVDLVDDELGALFVMPNLGRHLSPDYKPPTPFSIIQAVLESVKWMWENLSLYHNDIKPHNLVMNSAGVIKLIDFGAAASARQYADTLRYETLGTLFYMAPERQTGGPPSAASEIWSLGMTLRDLGYDENVYTFITKMLENDPAKRGSFDEYLKLK
jgi:hypothetical protein